MLRIIPIKASKEADSSAFKIKRKEFLELASLSKSISDFLSLLATAVCTASKLLPATNTSPIFGKSSNPKTTHGELGEISLVGLPKKFSIARTFPEAVGVAANIPGFKTPLFNTIPTTTPRRGSLRTEVTTPEVNSIGSSGGSISEAKRTKSKSSDTPSPVLAEIACQDTSPP